MKRFRFFFSDDGHIFAEVLRSDDRREWGGATTVSFALSVRHGSPDSRYMMWSANDENDPLYIKLKSEFVEWAQDKPELSELLVKEFL